MKKLLLSLLLLLATGAEGKIFILDALDSTHIADSIGAASTTLNVDTIVLPEDTCTFFNTFLVMNKGFVMLGKGIDKTILRDSTAVAYNKQLFDCYPKGRKIRFANMTIYYTWKIPDQASICVNDSAVVRFDHIKFTGDTSTTAVYFRSWYVRGVMDKCALLRTRCGVGWYGQSTFRWTQPVIPGDSMTMYEENNYFDENGTGLMNVADAGRGGTYVWRNNYSRKGFTEVHGMCQCSDRSAIWFEVYNNLLVGDGIQTAPMGSAGGSGVFFGNRTSGTFSGYYILIQEHRAAGTYGTVCTDRGFCNCTGNCTGDGNTIDWDGYHNGSNGYDTLILSDTTISDSAWVNSVINNVTQDWWDTVLWCNGTKVWCGSTAGSKAFNNNDVVVYYSGYPCKDQVGRTTNQGAFGVFEWNNSRLDNGADIDIAYNTSVRPKLLYKFLHEDVDYFNDSALSGYTPFRFPYRTSEISARDIWYDDSANGVSSSGFAVLAHIYNDTGAVILQTAPASDSTNWTSQDTAFGSDNVESTPTLTASGLSAETKYYTRLLYEGAGYISGLRDTIDSDGLKNGIFDGWPVVTGAGGPVRLKKLQRAKISEKYLP